MMSKLVSDLFDISELAHHGPENLFISLIKIIGSFIFLFMINRMLAVPMLILVVLMLVFSYGQAQLDEKLEFKVIEFNKDAKRIILSHSRIFEDAAKAEERAEKKAATKKSTGKREDVAPAIQNQAASTTLGDIDALAALKEQMEAGKK